MIAVVICGSLSQPDTLAEAKAAEEAAGRLVTAWPHGERIPDEDAYQVWLRAIRDADQVVVVPKPDGSLGDATLGEIVMAFCHRKPVRIHLGPTVHSGPAAYHASGCHTPQAPDAPFGCVLPGGPEYADLPDCEACEGMGKDRAAVDAWYESAPSPAEVREVLGMARHGEQQRRADALARGDDLTAHYPQVSADGREVTR